MLGWPVSIRAGGSPCGWGLASTGRGGRSARVGAPVVPEPGTGMLVDIGFCYRTFTRGHDACGKWRQKYLCPEELDGATGGKKLSFSVNQRRRLAEDGKLLTPDERRNCCPIVKPATHRVPSKGDPR